MKMFPALANLLKSPLHPTSRSRLLRSAFSLSLATALWHAGPASARADGALVETVKVGGFAVGKYEVTQAQYEAVMGKNPSAFKGPRKPVENVSWEEAMKFCKKLTDSEHQAGRLPAGQIYTLPTQKQWNTFAAGTSLDTAVTSLNGKRRSTEDVGSMRPNHFGLYDVRGNVWEWCRDTEEQDSDAKIIRGGAFANADKEKLDLNFKQELTPLFKIPGVGFRVVIVGK